MKRKKQALTLSSEVESIDAVYTHKGVVCPFVIPQGTEVVELESWALIRNDLNCALESFKFINEVQFGDQSETIKRSLLFAAIISYAKPFSEGRGRVCRLRKDDVFSGKGEYKSIHNQIIKLRNKYVAHGDKTKLEQAMIRVALSPNTDQKEVLDIYHMVVSTAGLETNTIENYVAVTGYVLDFVKEKVANLNAYVSQEARKQDIEYLYENSYEHSGVAG